MLNAGAVCLQRIQSTSLDHRWSSVIIGDHRWSSVIAVLFCSCQVSVGIFASSGELELELWLDESSPSCLKLEIAPLQLSMVSQGSPLATSCQIHPRHLSLKYVSKIFKALVETLLPDLFGHRKPYNPHAKTSGSSSCNLSFNFEWLPAEWTTAWTHPSHDSTHQQKMLARDHHNKICSAQGMHLIWSGTLSAPCKSKDFLGLWDRDHISSKSQSVLVQSAQHHVLTTLNWSLFSTAWWSNV